MSGSSFNEGLRGASPHEDQLEIKSSSGRFIFLKSRLYGVNHFIKRPSKNFEGDYQSLASLRKEYNIGLQLNHPSIIRYISFDGFSLCEEYVEGETLRQLIERKDSRLKESAFIRNLCLKLLDALDYIHAKGIVHQDLKPENIMISRIGNEIKIIDFGCAVSPLSDETPGFTPGYMAPEQIGGNVNASTDIYQLGKIIEELISDLKVKHKWKKFISGTIADNPLDRFKSASEALKAVPDESVGFNFKPLAISMIIIAIGLFIYWIIEERNTSARETQENIDEEIRFATSENPKEDTLPQANTELLNKELPVNNYGLESKLKDKIENTLENYYKINVIPYYENPEQFGLTAGSEEEGLKQREVLVKAKEHAYQLSDSLIQKYPAYKELIENMTFQSISDNQTKIGVIYSRKISERQRVRSGD